MVSYGQWISFIAVACTVAAMAFSGVGLASPWWIGEASRNGYPITTQANLWVTSTSWYEVPEESRHFGCTDACDRTKFGRLRMITACQAWEEVCPKARSACGAPPGPAPIVGGPAPPPPATAPPEPPSSTPYPHAPTLPPPDMPEEARLTTTTTTFLVSTVTTETTTSFTTRTTEALTPMPMTTRPFLNPEGCPFPTQAQIDTAAYTEWEEAWSMDVGIITTLYFELNLVMTRIPAVLFAQRPTTIEQVRLFWEVLVQRNGYPEWMWQYERDWCPSIPSVALHDWFIHPDNYWTYELAKTSMKPPDVPESYFPEITDGYMKEAWEIQLGLRRTTPAPILEEGSQAWHAFAETINNPNPGPPDIGKMPPQDNNVVIKAEKPIRFRGEPQMTFASCQKAIYDGEQGPPHWLSLLSRCKLRTSCDLIWAIRSGVMLQVLLGLLFTAPSCLGFIGAGTRFGIRFPPAFELYLAGGSFGLLVVVVCLSFSVQLPEDADPPLKLQGFGFGCGIISMCCCFGALVFSKLATGVDDAEKALKAKEKAARQDPVPVKAPPARIAPAPPDPVAAALPPTSPMAALPSPGSTGMLALPSQGSAGTLALPSPASPAMGLPSPSSTCGSMGRSPNGGQRTLAWGTKAEMQIAMQA